MLFLYLCSPNFRIIRRGSDQVAYSPPPGVTLKTKKMYAIVDIAGQQFKVEKGHKIFVHRLEEEEGKDIDFDKVLLIDDNSKVLVGEPQIEGAYIQARVLEHMKGDKVIVFKKKRRKGYKVKKGHRQQYSRIEILSINETGFVKKAVKEEDKTAASPGAKAPAVKTEAKQETKEKATAAKKPAEKKETAGKKTAAEKKTGSKTAAEKETGSKTSAEKEKPAAKKEEGKAAATKKTPAAKKTAPKKAAEKKPAAEKKSAAAKKPAAKKAGTAKPKTASKAKGDADKKADKE